MCNSENDGDGAVYLFSEADLDWALEETFLYFGREGVQSDLWALYVEAQSTRDSGERNYAAEEELFRRMLSLRIMER